MKIVLVFYLLIFPLHATASDYMEMTHPNKLGWRKNEIIS